MAALAVFVVAGCGGSTVRGEEGLPDPTIKFVNAASDSGAIEFYLNDELKAANVNYLSASGPFIKVPFKSDLDGGYDLSSRVPGSQDDIDRISNLLFCLNWSFLPHETYPRCPVRAPRGFSGRAPGAITPDLHAR